MNSKKKVLSSTAIALLLGLTTTGTAYADELKTGIVNTSVLNVRSGPRLSSKVIDQVNRGEMLQLVESTSTWCKVRASQVSTGWVSKSYIKEVASNISRGSDLSSRGSTDLGLRDKLVNYAKTFLGVPYVWGGTSTAGFDCSGLMKYVYSHFGYSLKRVAADQATQGIPVDKAQLKPGDLLFFDTNKTASEINHVGMYIGDGHFIHAANSQKGIIISDITKGFYAKTLIKARNILDK